MLKIHEVELRRDPDTRTYVRTYPHHDLVFARSKRRRSKRKLTENCMKKPTSVTSSVSRLVNDCRLFFVSETFRDETNCLIRRAEATCFRY